MQDEPIIRDVKQEAERILAEAPQDPKVQVERLAEEGLLQTGLATGPESHPPLPLVEEDTE